ARLEPTEHGLMPKGEGWFVLNAREARWRYLEGRGAYSMLEGEPEFSQLGISLCVLGPGEPMAMYHWETDQEDFLVLAGEALLIVEGEERPVRALPDTPQIADLVGVQLAWFRDDHPVAILGFLELEAHQADRATVERLIERTGLPRAAFGQLLLHARQAGPLD